MSILVVGSVALDSVETPFGKRNEILGGSASYFSICANFFTKVNIVAVVGRDFPRKYVSILRSRGINLDGLEMHSGKTFRWKGFYTHDLDTANTISTELNVFAEFKPRLPDLYKNIKNIFLANIDPDLQCNVVRQVRNPRFIACDSMNYWIDKKKMSLMKLFKNMDLVFLNESEARDFSGCSNLIEASKFIVSCGPKFVMIKRGEAGAILFGRDFRYCAPAFLCENIKDPTGAGDSFAGGFMGYISKCPKVNRVSLCRAITYGTVMASYAIEDFSIGRLLRLKNSDINRRLGEYKKLVSLV